MKKNCFKKFIKMISIFFFVAFSFCCNDLGYETECSNHGICAFSNNSTHCVCTDPYIGKFCNETAATTTPETTLTTRPTCYRFGINPCSGHGECEVGFAGMTYCKCDSNFYTGESCEVAHKSKWVAFFLALFLGEFGVARFYLGYAGFGVLQLVFLGFSCVACGVGKSRNDISANYLILLFLIFCVCCIIACLCWWLADWIKILAGTLPDSNGVALV